MSATGRKKPQLALEGVDLAKPTNYFQTEDNATRAIIPHLRLPDGAAPRAWMDVGCGRGEIAQWMRAAWPAARGLCVEIDPGRADDARRKGLEVIETDWIESPWSEDIEPDIILTNPPFSFPKGHKFYRSEDRPDLWTWWVRHCLDRVAPHGEVAVIGRLGVLQAKPGSHRDELFEHEPCDVYATTWRVSFDGGKGTDSEPAGWFVFGESRTGKLYRLDRPEPLRR